MANYKFNVETLYEKTDNGLDIIKKYLDNCDGFGKALENPPSLARLDIPRNSSIARFNSRSASSGKLASTAFAAPCGS